MLSSIAITGGKILRRYTRVIGFLFCALFLSGFQADRTKFASGNLQGLDKEGRQVSALLFRPSGESRSPAVVLLHTCGGLSQHVTQDWPQYLTGLGYVVLTVDSYGSRRYSRCTDRQTWKGDQAKDAFGALDYLAGLPFVDAERIAVMGFSAGGTAINDVIISVSRQRTDLRNYKAAISLYGKCGYGMDAYTDEDVPMMQILGELDRKITRDCISLTKNKPIEVHEIKGAYHAFDSPEHTSIRKDPRGSPMLYDRTKTREARELTRAFLAKHLR